MRIACFVLATALAATPALAAEDLGTIDFPTSAESKEAQELFLRGVLLLHSFTFEAAEKTFIEAREIEPDFFMAYWGEALSHNHPLLAERNPDLPRQVLSRLGPTRDARLAKAPTEREKGFMEAVEILFGEGSEEERTVAYAEAMGRLAAKYPDDDEVQAFYSVSMLGRVRFGHDKDFRLRMKAGSIAENIYRDESQTIPGAAHYVIHSFDDPVHAPLALTAAYRYAEIAPGRGTRASHAVSHLSFSTACGTAWSSRMTPRTTRRFGSGKSVIRALRHGEVLQRRLRVARARLGAVRAAPDRATYEKAKAVHRAC